MSISSAGGAGGGADPDPRLPRRLGVARYFDGSRIRDGDVQVAAGVITGIGLPPGPGGLASPGWIDLQVNGFAGIDVARATPAELAALAQALTATGVTSFLPTVITARPENAGRAIRAIADARGADGVAGARILGAHLEGPFLSAAYSGAHPRELLREDPDQLVELASSPGVAMLTVAPEVLGGSEVIERLVALGRRVSIGHTNATAAESRAAFDAGATALTHAFNAHRPIGSREPGPLGAALADPEVVLTMITDGVHVAAENLVFAHHAAPGRIALVTDCIVATGVPDGDYEFGPLSVAVAGGRALLSDGTLAGSVATMDVCVAHAASLWGLEAALAAATRIPAELIGRPDLGVLALGAPADLVILDDILGDRLDVEETIVRGATVWQRERGRDERVGVLRG